MRRSVCFAFPTLVLVNYTTCSTVQTALGPVFGKRIEADLTLNSPIMQPIDAYLGIPFAQPPVGPLRFRPPVPLSGKWSTPLNATVMPPKCVSASGGQEDCLYLNVFRPSTSTSKPRAVMLWIYGGGFSSGSIKSYDATALAAAEDVIVVMGNYRLGMLGFLSSEWSFAESGTTGNWGLLDQKVVMQWVQENIAAFGGDPTSVTIFGESAGAFSVLSHLVSEGSAGLFSGAIIQSGTTKVEMFYQSLEDAYAYNEWYAKVHLNCVKGLADVDCLRKVPATRFVISSSERDGMRAPTWGGPIFPMFTSAPVIDGVVLKGTPHELALAGKIIPGIKSIVIGTTQDEGSVFTTQLTRIIRPKIEFPPKESELRYTFEYILRDEEVADHFITNEYPKYKEYYGNRADPDKPEFRDAEFQFVSNIIRNTMFACPSVTFAEAVASANKIPVYMYNFALKFWPTSSKNFPIGKFLGDLGNMTTDDLGAFHSAENPFLFKMFFNRNITINDINAETPFAIYMAPAFTQPGDKLHRVSDMMTCFWANVARCGSPGCRQCSGMSWPEYTEADKNFMSFEFDGSLKVRSIESSGDTVIGEAFPSLERCNWYMTLKTPFHDLRADLKLPLNLRESFELNDPNGGAAVYGTLFSILFSLIIAM
jgi:carboxylesterase type B